MTSWFILAGSSLYFSLIFTIFGCSFCMFFIDFIPFWVIGQKTALNRTVTRMMAMP